MNEKLELTVPRLILVREMAEGPKTHAALRLAYYGEARAKNPANTSFYNKLKASEAEGLVKKVSEGIYTLDVKGLEMLAEVREKKMDLTVLKSEAQIEWEATHS